MDIYNEEIGKYKKKMHSNTSKSKEKSKHKHTYEECLLVCNNNPHHATYCTICGKIGNIAFFETERLDNGCYRQLDKDEVFEKFKKLKYIEIHDIWQKYVPLVEVEGGY